MNITDLLTTKSIVCRKDKDDYVIQGTLKTNNIPVLFSKNKYVENDVVTCVRRMPYKYTRPWKIRKCHAHALDVTSFTPYQQPITFLNKVLNVWDMYTATMLFDAHSFVFSDKYTFLKSFKNVEKLAEKFNFKTCFEPELGNMGLETALSTRPKTLYFIITIYNIEAFCPIFNVDNIDGLGIAVEVLDLKSSIITKKPNFKQNNYYILSNYKDNLFYIDGVQLQKIKNDLHIAQYCDMYFNTFKKAEKIFSEVQNTGITNEAWYTIGNSHEILEAKTAYTDTLFTEELEGAEPVPVEAEPVATPVATPVAHKKMFAAINDDEKIVLHNENEIAYEKEIHKKMHEQEHEQKIGHIKPTKKWKTKKSRLEKYYEKPVENYYRQPIASRKIKNTKKIATPHPSDSALKIRKDHLESRRKMIKNPTFNYNTVDFARIEERALSHAEKMLTSHAKEILIKTDKAKLAQGTATTNTDIASNTTTTIDASSISTYIDSTTWGSKN